MKRYSYFYVLAVIVMLVFSGCSSERNDTGSARDELNFRNEVIQAVKTKLSQDEIYMLWDGTESISAHAYDGNANATARVGKPEYIPELAELLCPIIVELSNEKGYEIGHIDLQYYEENIDDGSLVNWNTRDGISGTFLIESEDIIKTDADIEYLSEYYGNISGIEKASTQYQGEWQCQEDDGKRLFGSGTSINFVSDSEIGDKSYRHVTSFELGYNESGDIVVCGDVGNPCYGISLENDVLYITQISSGAVETYVKISDRTEVPKEKIAPSMGMTEDEVLNSTWGAPIKRNKTSTLDHEREQWVYDDGYIYFVDGIVTSIQEK